MKNLAIIVLLLSGVTGFMACCAKVIEFAKRENPFDLLWTMALFIIVIVLFILLRKLIK